MSVYVTQYPWLVTYFYSARQALQLVISILFFAKSDLYLIVFIYSFLFYRTMRKVRLVKQ